MLRKQALGEISQFKQKFAAQNRQTTAAQHIQRQYRQIKYNIYLRRVVERQHLRAKLIEKMAFDSIKMLWAAQKFDKRRKQATVYDAMVELTGDTIGAI